MKKITLVTFITLIQCIGFKGITQENQISPDYEHYKIFKKALEKELNAYYKINDKGELVSRKIIQYKLLSENITNAFNTVVFGNTNLAANSSAFGYSQNKDKTNVSANASFRLYKKFYWSAGANVEGSGAIFEFYSDESWKNNVSGNLSLIYRFGRSGQFYDLTSDQKQSRINRRKIFSNNFLKEVSHLKRSDVFKDIDTIQKSLINNQFVDSIPKKYTYLDSFPKVKELIIKKKFIEAYDEMEKKRTLLETINKKIGNKKDLEAFIRRDILYNYDKTKDITEGYYFNWVRAGLNMGNSSYTFNKDNIEPILLENPVDNVSFTEAMNKLKTTASIDFNRISNSKKRIYFMQTGTSISTGSFLSNELIEGTPFLFQNGTDASIRDENGIVFGNFDQIEKTLSTGSLYFYGALFLGAKKKLGFNASLKHNYLITRPDNTFYENNYTILFGPVFRTVKNDNTSISFGIDIGWENAIYNVKASDYFTGRIRLGIPFGIYKKAKKSEKK